MAEQVAAVRMLDAVLGKEAADRFREEQARRQRRTDERFGKPTRPYPKAQDTVSAAVAFSESADRMLERRTNGGRRD